MHANVEFAQKVALAYGAVCKPLCRELGLTQTAFDILLFLSLIHISEPTRPY